MRKYVFGEKLWRERDMRSYGFELPYDQEDRKRLRHLIGGMIHRCYNPNDKYYSIYGWRGITVCEEWCDAETKSPKYPQFYKWLIAAGWKKGMQIDRIDNDKGYCPENCRIVEPKVNCRNRSSNRMMTFRGETKSMAEWAEVLGISYSAISHRISRGMSDEEALTKAVSVGNTKFIEYDGRKQSMKQWAEEVGMSYGGFCNSLRSGKTIGEIIERRKKLGRYKVAS